MLSAVFFFYIKGLCGEGEFDFFFLESFHDFEVYPLVDLLVKPVVRRFDPVCHVDIERTVVEIAEINAGAPFGVGVYLRDVGEYLFDYIDGVFCFLAAGIVCNSDVGCSADKWSFTDVFNRGVGNGIIR